MSVVASSTLLQKFARYLLTGGLAAIVDAGGFALLVRAGMPLPAAAVTSFLLAAVVNYVTSAVFVFHQRPTARHFLMFLTGALVGLLLNVGVTLAVAHWLGYPPVVAKVIGIGCAFLLNFTLNVLVVFQPRH